MHYVSSLSFLELKKILEWSFYTALQFILYLKHVILDFYVFSSRLLGSELTVIIVILDVTNKKLN